MAHRRSPRHRTISFEERSRLASLPAPEAVCPVDADRTSLYTAETLYDAADYADTLDARTYVWAKRPRERDAARQRALHDFAIDEALDDWVAEQRIGGRRFVGVMGGHDAVRGDAPYRAAAALGHRLGATYVIATGGGPGSMEAANLGAWFAAEPSAALDAAVDTLATVPAYAPSITAWARVALEVRGRTAGTPNLGIPTWHYGHEPPNVFASAIAKYFKNAQREAVLLNVCDGGVVFLPGAAGTVQEIFQDACENYYATPETVAPMILLGRDYWTRQLPAWGLLEALASNGGARPMAERIHLADSIDEVQELLARR